MLDYERIKNVFEPWQIEMMKEWEEKYNSLSWPERQLYSLLDGYPIDTASTEFQQADSLNDKGWDCHVAKKYRDAVNYYEEALKLCPDFPMCLNNKGLAHYRLNEFDLAKESYLRAMEINPHFVKPYSNLGILFYELLHDAKEAVIWFKRALALDPNYQRALDYLYRIENSTV